MMLISTSVAGLLAGPWGFLSAIQWHWIHALHGYLGPIPSHQRSDTYQRLLWINHLLVTFQFTGVTLLGRQGLFNIPFQWLMKPVGFQRELGAFPEDLVGSLTKAVVYSWGKQVAEVLTHIAPMCLSLHTNPGMHFGLSMPLTNEVSGEIIQICFNWISGWDLVLSQPWLVDDLWWS